MEVLALVMLICVIGCLFNLEAAYKEQKRHNKELERISKEQSEFLRQIEYRNRVR